MSSAAGHRDSPSLLRDPLPLLGPGALLAGVALAPLAAADPALTVVGAAAIALAVAVAVYPPLAAFLIAALTPVIVGIDRGAMVPLLRPNEVLLLVVVAGLLAGLAVALIGGRAFRPRFGRVDGAIALLATTGSVLPLLWMAARGVDITQDDLLHALTLWKYLVLYLVVRASVRSVRDVTICLWLSLGAGCVVAAVGILQVLGLFGVPEFLAAHYAPFDQERAVANLRGSSTIAAPQAVADVLTFNLAIAVGLILAGSPRRSLLIAICPLLLLGALASGQFSGVLALVVGVVAFGVLMRRITGAIAAFIPLGLIATLALQPLLDRRLAGLDPEHGVPASWVNRIENLQTYFLPEITQGWNWLLGVRPSARIAAPDETGRIWIFIESGHVWFLWSGGVLMLGAFVYFLWATIPRVWRVARSRSDGVGVAATASFVSLVVIAVLTTFDPHFTTRGTADLTFLLLALALSGIRPAADLPRGRSDTRVPEAPVRSRAAPGGSPANPANSPSV